MPLHMSFVEEQIVSLQANSYAQLLPGPSQTVCYREGWLGYRMPQRRARWQAAPAPRHPVPQPAREQHVGWLLPQLHMPQCRGSAAEPPS